MTKLRQLWLLTALASVAVLAAGYFLMVSPQKNTAAEVRDETETQLAANRQLKSQIDMLNKQKKNLPAQQAKLAEFAGLIPSNPSLPTLVRALSDAADRSNVMLIGIFPVLPSFAKQVNAQTGTELPNSTVAGPKGTVLADVAVKLRIQGHYSNVALFFDEIEELKRALLVSDLTIKRQEVKFTREPTGDGVEDPDNLAVEIGAHVMMTTKVKAAPVAPVTTSTDADATK